jgi:Carboxypeptidase regulatory-like domain
MQDVPNIVRDRLRAATPAVNHPDADVLTAFAERSLPALERSTVLEHLARCRDCRDIVALALPATEPLPATALHWPRAWLTWPALRWGFVAAGFIAIASFGALQYQRRLRPATMAARPSPRLEVAANESNRSIAQFAATPPSDQNAKKEKLQSPSVPAFADSVDREAMADNDKKSAAPADLAPAKSAAAPVMGGSAGAAIGGPLPHGPRLANQWQQPNMAQNQAPVPVPSRAYSKQEQARDRSSAASQNADASADSAMSTEHAQPSSQAPSQADSAYAVGKAKPPVPLASPGQIGGYVVDPTGAVVSNARITITPSNLGGSATAVTNSQGAWLIAGLPTGSYKAQAEAPGFKTTVLDLAYDSTQPSTYSFMLSPGSVSETVEVSSGQSVQLQTETATAGSVEVSQAPVNGRQVGQMAALSPALLPRWAINAAGALERSFDQGNTWQPVDVNANLASAPASTSLEVISRTSRAKKDTGKTLKRDASTPAFRAVAAVGSDVWAGGSAGALYHSLNAGNQWIRVFPASPGATLTGDIIRLEFPDSQHGKISTSTLEVWITSDDGQTWQKQ